MLTIFLLSLSHICMDDESLYCEFMKSILMGFPKADQPLAHILYKIDIQDQRIEAGEIHWHPARPYLDWLHAVFLSSMQALP
jgi:hypothetical protein